MKKFRIDNDDVTSGWLTGSRRQTNKLIHWLIPDHSFGSKIDPSLILHQVMQIVDIKYICIDIANNAHWPLDLGLDLGTNGLDEQDSFGGLLLASVTPSEPIQTVHKHVLTDTSFDAEEGNSASKKGLLKDFGFGLDKDGLMSVS